MVGVDKAGHDDLACGVDHMGVRGFDVRADLKDLAALDQHVTLGKVANAVIDGHDHAALDQDACPFLARKLRQGCGADLGGYSLRGSDTRLAVSRGRQKGRAAGAKRLGCCGAT